MLVQVVTCASDLMAKSEGPPTSSFSVLINLLEWLTELRETFYLVDHQCLIRGYNSGRAKWKGCIGHGYVGRGHGASRLSERTPLPKPPTWKLSDPGPFAVLGKHHYTGLI